MHQIEFHIGHRDNAHVSYYHKLRLKVVLLLSIPAVFCWRTTKEQNSLNAPLD